MTGVGLRTSPSGKAAVLSLHGEHDLSTAPEIRRQLLDALGAEVLVVDFAGCTFLDSTVLGVLVGGLKRTAKDGGRLVGVNATGIVHKVLAITGVADLLLVSDGLDPEAAALLCADGTPPP